ncbi:cadherin-related tumor suppressor-like [Gigantopelta aegis]|uniref:cadherin-related tumor suppressor-like n=1 Tax=Gigantopelta aegis TaxID=1735272 RepID=UPI001B887909|nr:cadherin-related tumor suppressor-like [Gigantopelta aegis]
MAVVQAPRQQKLATMTRYHVISLILLQFLVKFGQGEAPGDSVKMSVQEELNSGTIVGQIPVRSGYVYNLQEPSPYFSLNRITGVIVTKVKIDRESMSRKLINMFILGTQSGKPAHPVDVLIDVLDINDNRPEFQEQSINIAIQEHAKPGFQQLMLTARDNDNGVNGTISSYTIKSGNEDGKFRLLEPNVETPFMYLEVQGDLNREVIDFYQLNITAWDQGTPPREGYILVNITISDINDKSPTFNPSEYNPKINESAPIGTLVVKVIATDGDIGLNAEVGYRIQTDESGQFVIEERTGVVRTLVSPLSCSRKCGSDTNCNPKSCRITIEAFDRGTPSFSGRAYVYVDIIDENNHNPVILITHYPDQNKDFSSVDENVQAGITVASVSIQDLDEGINGKASLTITGGNQLGHFKLSTYAFLNLNLIKVVGHLDREKVDKYNLTFEAVDHGYPPRSSTAFLIIMVSDANDHAPEFQKKEYNVQLSELSLPGSFVESIIAIDGDSGVNSQLTYSIISGNDLEWFSIDTTTGLVTTKTQLDHEHLSKVVLNISAQDSGSQSFRNYTKLTITILDENDETPQFSKPVYEKLLNENMPTGTDIVTVLATDSDSGKNGSVIYEFHSSVENLYPGTFLLQRNGHITTAKPLDREDIFLYKILVVAHDEGVPALSSTAEVHLKVNDVNDNSPDFHPWQYFASVLENQPSGVQVVQVSALDPDEQNNGRITYAFIGNNFNSFAIDSSSGWITTTRRLSRSTKSVYQLNVRASDGGGRSSDRDAVVEVVIANANDVPPVFNGRSYSFSVIEDSDGSNFRSQRLGQVTATSLNGNKITYAIIAGDSMNIFSIDRNSGVIMTSKPVDREIKANYELKVAASSGSRFREITVTVEVIDINDNAPKFMTTTFETTVIENWPIGFNIFFAKATDADSGPNAIVSYALTSDARSVFKINSTTGVIYLAKPVNNLAVGKSFKLTVIATDAGTPHLSSSIDITVHIQDINDHTPVFPRNRYEISIYESKAVNEPVFKLLASDSDFGINGQISFNITSGNRAGKFGIFPDGTLFIAHSLDRERKDVYFLSVVVRDHGLVYRSSTANITIHVLDDNDNSPKFSNASYHFFVKENMPADTFVGIVKASDADAGRNAELTYSVDEHEENFYVDVQKGTVYTRKSFDREFMLKLNGKNYFTLKVTATDSGLKRLQDKVVVNVYVTDDNDNAPVFARQKYTQSIAENARHDSPVKKVTATDADTGSNAALSYIIQGGNEDNMFNIEQTTGQVLLQGQLDRETKDWYEVIILATDTGENVQLSASTTLQVTVTDFNDNRPQIASHRPQVSILESVRPGELIAEFEASDRDMANNAVVFFSIASGNEDVTFNLDANSGKMYLNKQLDFEQRQRYDLRIVVSDAGSPSLQSSTNFVVKVQDANDNSPQFSPTPISVDVSEGATVDTKITTAKATDEDLGNNGKIMYHIAKQDPPGDNFRIGSTTGAIFIKTPLDREAAQVIQITVIATDQAMPVSKRFSSQKIVTVIIRDINDNKPVFKSMDTLVIASAAAPGVFETIKASDADLGENGRVTFEMQYDRASMFSLKSNGELSLVGSLSRSTFTYSITVKARDHGDSDVLGAQSTTMTITILVVSSSQVGPRFAQSLFSGNINENAPAGSSITTVRASSSRSGIRVEYYITEITSTGTVQGRYFKIDKSSGIITNVEVLDREKLPEKFDIKAYAAEIGGDTARTRSTQVQVTLVDENDTPPIFVSSFYSKSVPENKPPGHNVFTVDVYDPDQTGSLQLSLSGDGSEDFTIAQDGTVKTQKRLNRRSRSAYSFEALATDGSHTSKSTIDLTVLDENDNEPKFTQPMYSFDIPEDTNIGTTVAQISATDDDDDSNGQVTYELESDWGKDKFQLEASLGTITLISQLDFEEVQLYTLKVIAKDGGSPQRSSSVTVYMNVNDVNDNTPVFDPMSYSQEMWENAHTGATVLNVSATDVDSGLNSEIQYSLVGGDLKNQFSIGLQNGTVYTVASLDREDIPSYSLIVMATDQAEPPSSRLFTTATVDIKLKDINDCAPEFQSPNQTAVKENTPAGQVVFTVSATDRDDGINKQLRYTLSKVPGFGYPFTINPVTGELRVNSDLDRESVENYTLKITATDKGQPPLSTSQNLEVVIKDANDNSPVFVDTFYSITIAENIGIGTSLLTVSANDLDKGLNGMVRYYIVGGDSNYDFNMDMSSGVLRVLKNLDYERIKVYHLVVQAQDSGIDVIMSSTASIVVNITDFNDYVPAFVDSPYIAYVQENMERLPVHVIQVTAQDEDSSVNSQLEYSLLSDEHKNIFSMNSQTGEIQAHQTLDRETLAEYSLVVVAKDSGNPRLTGTGTINVMVQDVNDHAPVFENGGSYTGHVMEGKSASTEVLVVKASDIDEGINAQIVYSLADSKGQRFTIHPDSGVIVTLGRLDREEYDEYHLVVIATDRGIPPQSASTDVTIYIDDANDNAPQFEQQGYARVILDPTNTGDFVLGVTAVDPDVGSNGKVTYSLSGTDANKFQINPNTGVITAAQRLSGSSASYHFQVTASDQGTTPLSHSVNVKITMLVNNSHRPVFNSFDSNLQILENSPVHKILTTVKATTTRTNEVIYNIAGGNVNRGFTIHRSNGTISVYGIIDYETSQTLDLWIEANDGGSPALFTYKKLPVRVLDVNDNAPRFQQLLYNTTIKENVDKGSMLVVVAAGDADSGDNGKLVYSIVSGNKNNTFTIGRSSGVITTRNIVDREGYDYYHLIVQAADLGSRSRSSTCTVQVHVLDMNDNPSKFTRQFKVEISENMPYGSFVIQITSTDKDIGINAVPRYKLSSQMDKFAIDPTSGNITTKVVLNAEQQQRYFPEIKVTDGAFTISTRVSIRIKDENDNAPFFSGDSLSFDFQEHQDPNTVIGILKASDKDVSAPNNRFIFSLKRPSDLFSLEADSGKLLALQTMSYVHTSEGPSPSNRHSLDVIVSDLGSPVMSSETTIVITIVDANDHPPIFLEDEYFSAVPQNSAVNDPVIQVKAEDTKDFGINAEKSYSISGGNGTRYFSVQQDTGVVYVRSSLIGLKSQDVYLIVKATDKGNPPQSSTVPVHLSVTDVNNHTPVFKNIVFRKSFRENIGVGYIIDTLVATDDDTGLNGQVKYIITSGNNNSLFSIGKTSGVLKVGKELDFETVPIHYLNITARDMGLLFKETSVIYTISLQDVNDNPPLFMKSVFDAYIPENSETGTSFFTLQAHDADSGDNAVIHYNIVGNNEQVKTLFSIDQNSGILRAKGDLDYEVTKNYELSIMALNPGSANMKSVAMVNVHVTGVNEFYPMFTQAQYRFEVHESTALNSTVGQVFASDKDDGTDGIVYYFLIGSSNLKGFQIDHRTGTIYVSRRPDYESSPQITLTVMAKNWGSIHGNDTDQCVVIIGVEDSNDPPVFSQQLYNSSISENSPRDTSVIQVSATDNDKLPENRQFVYKILSGSGGSRFRIDPHSGIIKTTGQGILDREKELFISVVVGAVDSGSPPETGTATVKIYLMDVNDSGPEFNPPVLEAYVLENQNGGRHVITLSQYTNDSDAHPNRGPYRYHELNDPTMQQFQIGERSGIVTTKVKLDREVTPKFIVPVVVTDGGRPTQTSTLSFTIIVQDQNDSPPESRQLLVALMLLDGMETAGKIADVRPADSDIVGNYSCFIVNGKDDVFSIFENCDLRVTNNPLLKQLYSLKINGSDGNPNHQSVTYDISVSVTNYDNRTIDNSVAMLLGNIEVESFLELQYASFMTAVRSVVGIQNSGIVYSIKPFASDVLVFLAVQQQNGNYFSKSSLKQQLSNATRKIESASGVRIKDVSFGSCKTNPCKNFGTCDTRVVMTSGYTINNSPKLIWTSATPEIQTFCWCMPSYTGQFCEIPLERCGGDYCYNGGTCLTNDDGNKQCHCVPGWSGPSCQDDVNECIRQPCQNGGSCINTKGSFYCKCADGFYGNLCESSSHCRSHPCLNGGTCRDVSNSYVCQCKYEYFGSRCEKLSRGFSEGSYILHSSMTQFSNMEISVYFTTVKENALLLLNLVTVNGSPLGFVALEIVRGNVRFSFKLGSTHPKRLTVMSRVSDGYWHKVEVKKQHESVVLKVIKCQQDSTTCEECFDNDSSCYQSLTDDSGNLFLIGQSLSIGGVNDINDVLQYSGDIASHDFVGCAHSFMVNSRDMLDTSGARDKRGVMTSCVRKSPRGSCSANLCQNGGTCVDEWTSARCSCSNKYMGQRCEQEWEPFGFGADSTVKYKLRESYRRDQQVSKGRNRRAGDSSSIKLRFMTTSAQGTLFYSATEDTKCVLWIQDGKVKFVLTPPSAVNDPLDAVSVDVTDGSWHNVTVTVTGSTFVVSLDGKDSMSKDFGQRYSFASLEVEEMALSGARVVPSGNTIAGFSGCISEFLLDGDKLPFNGLTKRYEITMSEGVQSGCKALCSNNPCDEGQTCSVSGEKFMCVGSGGGLEIGIIIVIVFFAILIVAIIVVFIVLRKRRDLCRRICMKKEVKANGNLGSRSLSGSQDVHDSGYGENGNVEDMFIQNHITNGLILQKSGLSVRPDLIGSNVIGRSMPQPLQFDDGTVIIEHGEHGQMRPIDDNMPEHYDLENASSIAPSDIDVALHYKHYRSGKEPKYKANQHLSHYHKSHIPNSLAENPLTVSHGRSGSGLSRESPGANKMNGYPKMSPGSFEGSAVSMPAHQSPSMAGNIKRPSSAQPAVRHSPMPHSHVSPLSQLNMRNTPVQNIHMNNSQHSLGSHHSHTSSSSSATRIPNGHHPKSAKASRKPYSTKGLTVEEINRLNARPDRKSPVSMLEAVSSSSDDRLRRQKMKPVEHSHILLEPPDSSSEDSGANDSFTCSEFEYEPDHKTRSDFDPGIMIFSKLTEVENENDDTPQKRPPRSDGMDSNGDSFTSTVISGDSALDAARVPNGAFNFDELLNWGPNFDKLVGVFRDIALLPDNTTQTLEDGPGNDYEEYV